MREIHLTEDDVMDDASHLAGEKLDDSYWDTLVVDEDTTVYKPNGDVLAVFLADYVSEYKCNEAFKALRPCALQGGKKKGNRGTASGKGTRKQIVKEDGSVSDSPGVPPEISPMTNVAGYFDRYPRVPYCRQTAYNVNNPERFERAIPFFQASAQAFKEYVPERYQAQMEVAQDTVDDWVISQTPFTTVTVNLNWQTAVHTDSGDYAEGFGVMPVISAGDYEGAYFIQPKFGMAYDVRTGDILLNDVHEFHGNGPFHESSGYYERLSVVLYYREEMAECGTPEEELERAKREMDQVDVDPEDAEQPTQRDYSA